MGPEQKRRPAILSKLDRKVHDLLVSRVEDNPIRVQAKVAHLRSHEGLERLTPWPRIRTNAAVRVLAIQLSHIGEFICRQGARAILKADENSLVGGIHQYRQTTVKFDGDSLG